MRFEKYCRSSACSARCSGVLRGRPVGGAEGDRVAGEGEQLLGSRQQLQGRLRVSQGVHRCPTLGPDLHDAAVEQTGQVPAHRRLRQAEQPGQVLDRRVVAIHGVGDVHAHPPVQVVAGTHRRRGLRCQPVPEDRQIVVGVQLFGQQPDRRGGHQIDGARGDVDLRQLRSHRRPGRRRTPRCSRAPTGSPGACSRPGAHRRPAPVRRRRSPRTRRSRWPPVS